MSAESYSDAMSEPRNGVTSEGGMPSPHLFGGLRGFIRLGVVLSVLVALMVFFRGQSGALLPPWVAPVTTFAFLALVPVGAVLLYVFERRRNGRLSGTALRESPAAGGSGS